MEQSNASSAARYFSSEEVFAGGKINLFLLITGRRDDGYHELATLFVPLPRPLDRIVFSRADRDSGIRVQCGEGYIDPESNTLTKAYARYAEATGFAPAVDVALHKGIPSGAGLGGGSADGAAVLAWLQRRNPHPCEEQALLRLASRVGADVPFFLRNVPCLAEGIGEKLTPHAHGLEKYACLVVCPDIHVDTAWAYRAWDRQGSSFSLTAWRKADKTMRPSLRGLYGRNDFEPVVFPAWPRLSALKADLLGAGAEIAGLSGSGSALYGFFPEVRDAARAADRMKEKGVAVFGPFFV